MPGFQLLSCTERPWRICLALSWSKIGGSDQEADSLLRPPDLVADVQLYVSNLSNIVSQVQAVQADRQTAREAEARSKFAQQALSGVKRKLEGEITATDTQKRSVTEQVWLQLYLHVRQPAWLALLEVLCSSVHRLLTAKWPETLCRAKLLQLRLRLEPTRAQASSVVAGGGVDSGSDLLGQPGCHV